MSTSILHKRPRVSFDADGIRVRPLLFRALSLPWSGIRYISPTPEFEKADGIWAPRAQYVLPPTHNQAPPQRLGIGLDLELKLVANSLAVPTWMLFSMGSVYAQPLYDAYDRPKLSSHVVCLELNTARLSASVSALFDLLATHCRFDILVTD